MPIDQALNTETLLEIADFYKAGFVSKYREMAMGIYESHYDGHTLLMVKNGYPFGQDVF